jgi:predicted ATPase
MSDPFTMVSDDPASTLRIVGYASTSNLFILTGAPGSGKTAILSRLSDEFRCVDEPAREVLAEQRATGGSGTWDRDPSLFVHLLLQRSIEKYKTARRSGETVIFDRGIPDCVVYAVRAETDPSPSLTAVDALRYEPHVLFLEPWSDIYETDEERIMSFADTVSFSEALMDVYERSGYILVHVPRGSIDDRAAFVREFISRRQ